MLEKLFLLIDKMQNEIGDYSKVTFSIGGGMLRFQVYWSELKIRYRYQFPLNEIQQFRDGDEDFLISYLIMMSKKEYLRHKEKDDA